MGTQRSRFQLLLGALLLLAAVPAAPQGDQPSQPLDEIVRQFTQKEADYAAVHSLYRYHINIKVQEIGEGDRVVGEFEQTSEVDRDPSGRRVARLLGNPRVDLTQLGISRIELDDLDFVPLFILSPEQIPDYEITYLTRERLDEVPTYLFRLKPNRPVRPGERFFEGLVWVDAEKLDIVRAHGRTLPERSTGALDGYFRRIEVYREPVDNYLFPTYARADDVISVRDVPLRARLILRFSDHQRLEGAKPASAPSP